MGTINNIRYDDDTVLTADTDVGRHHIIDQLNIICQQYGMKINNQKTKTMVISKIRKVAIIFMINGEIIYIVYCFKYWVNG